MMATANSRRLKIGLLLAAAAAVVAGIWVGPQIRLSRTLAAARQALEAERQEQVKALNAQLAERRAAAQAETEAAKAAVRDQIHAAVADVAGRAGELATGRRPDATVVARVVNEVMAR